jgi:hypothetical protein
MEQKTKPIRYYGLFCTHYLLAYPSKITSNRFDGLITTLDKCSQESRPADVAEDEDYCRCDVCPLFAKCISAYDKLCEIVSDRRILLMPGDNIQARKKEKVRH